MSRGWIRVSLPPLRVMTGRIQHFQTAILEAWHFQVFSKLSERKGFLGVQFADIKGSLQLLNSTHLRDRDKMLLRAILMWREYGTDSFLVRPGRKMFLVDFVGREMVMDIYFGSVPFTPFNMFVTSLNFLFLCLWIVVSGLGAYSGMVGCLVLMVCLVINPGLLSLSELASFHLESCLGAYPIDFAAAWTPPDYCDAEDIALEIPEHPNIWTDGSRKDFSSIGGFEVAGAGVYLPASEIAFDNSVWGTVEEHTAMLSLSVAVLFFLSLGFCRLFSVLNFGVLLLLYRLTGLVI